MALLPSYQRKGGAAHPSTLPEAGGVVRSVVASGVCTMEGLTHADVLRGSIERIHSSAVRGREGVNTSCANHFYVRG